MAGNPEPLLPLKAIVTTPDLADNPDIFPRLRGMQFVGRGTEWNTTTLQAKDGRKFKTKNWTYPINKFAAKFATLNQDVDRRDLDRLDDFFNRRAGGYGNFYYWDPYRNLISDQIIGTGDGVTTTFQLLRTIRKYQEPIYALATSPVLKVNWEETSAFSIIGPGIIQFDTAPADGAPVSWSGSFMFWCEFTQDNLDVTQLNNHLYSNDGLEFQTIKL